MNRIDRDLANTFMFDAVDLAANRAGQLSPDQLTGYGAAARASRRQVPRLTVFMTILMVGLFVLVGVQSTVPMDQKYMIGGFLLLFYAVILLLVRRNYRLADNMEHLQLRVVQGTAEASPTTSVGFWKVEIGGVRFGMMSGDTNCFQPGVVYRVYYTELGKRPAILSAEVVG